MQPSETLDAASVVDAAVSTWQRIEAALSPIIGPLGFAALLRRSLYLTAGRYACLAHVLAASEPGAFTALKVALSQQTNSDATSASAALLETFHDLLSNLIGESLTERLLRPVRDNPSNDDAMQGTTR